MTIPAIAPPLRPVGFLVVGGLVPAVVSAFVVVGAAVVGGTIINTTSELGSAVRLRPSGSVTTKLPLLTKF